MPSNFIDQAVRRNQVYNRYMKETNLTRFEEGSKSRSIIDALLSYQDLIETSILEEINRANPLVASSTFQDYWLDFLGIQKIEATKVTARADQRIVKLYVDTGTFSDLDNGGTVTISPRSMTLVGRNRVFGDFETAEQTITYSNTELITMLPGDNEVWIGIEANGFGEAYRLEKNQLVSHDFSDYAAFGNVPLKVTNVVPITSGYDGDTEEILSSKIFRSAVFTDNDIEDKISNLLTEVAEVEDFLILPRFSGPGTVDVFVDNSFFTIDNTVLEAVRNRLEQIQNKGAQLFVSKVPRVGVTIILTVDFIPSVTTDDRVAIIDQIRNVLYSRMAILGIGETLDFLETANQIKASFPQLSSFGRANQYFDEVKIYRQGIVNDRVGSYFDQNTLLTLRPYERLFPETTFPNPIIVRLKNA